MQIQLPKKFNILALIIPHIMCLLFTLSFTGMACWLTTTLNFSPTSESLLYTYLTLYLLLMPIPNSATYLSTTAISASVWWIIHRVALCARRLEHKKLSNFLWVELGTSSKVRSGTKTSTAVWNMARLCASTKQDSNSMALLECGELCHALCIQLRCLYKMGMDLENL